ncbi:carbohydrate ABC transporter permease [Streptomyces sp.]|uniref:carbohydrate ABC transporter permease n=1 Tax=Streptomyces sp. TaxID=1931 RepID=UPI002F3FD65B
MSSVNSAVPANRRRSRASATPGNNTPRHPWLYTLVAVLIVVAMLLPVLWMLSASFQAGVTQANMRWLPARWSLSGYRDALDDQLGNIGTSTVVALGAGALSVAVAAPAAFALARIRSRIVGVILVVVLITQMIPGIVLSNAYYALFNKLGLLDTHLALIAADASMGIPFAIIVLRSFMLRMDGEILEAAMLDGAGSLRTFVSVVLPLSRNSLITAGVFAFIYAWGDFLFGLTLTTGSDLRPVTLGVYQYIGAQQISWSSVMASSLLASVPAILLLVVSQRYIKAGLSAGSGR